MNNSEMASEFMKYIGENYSSVLRSFRKADFGRHLTSDLFHDAIIKVNDKITTKGFKITKFKYSGQSFCNYLFITCGNEVMMDKRLDKKRNLNIIIDSDEEFEYLVPDYHYNQDDEYQREIERIHEDLLVDEILAFIKKRHKHLHCGIFEYYYRAGLGYRKLAKELGYKSYRSVWLIVDTVRKDIIEHFKGRNLPHRIINDIQDHD